MKNERVQFNSNIVIDRHENNGFYVCREGWSSDLDEYLHTDGTWHRSTYQHGYFKDYESAEAAAIKAGAVKS